MAMQQDSFLTERFSLPVANRVLQLHGPISKGLKTVCKYHARKALLMIILLHTRYISVETHYN